MIKRDDDPNATMDIQERTILVAEMYYIYKMSQQEIADRLSLSRPWISKLLKRAEDIGIVTFEVKSPSSGMLELEQKVTEKFGLKNTKIVRTGNEYKTQVDCAKAAAHYLASAIRPDDTISISWGYTLAAVAEQCPPMHLPTVTVLPLVGGVGMNSSILCGQIVATTADRLHAKYMMFHAPAFAASGKEKMTFMGTADIASIIQQGENADIVVMGGAGLTHSTLLEQKCVTDEELAQLAAKGAVGDISTTFINADGLIVDHPIHERLVSCNIRKTVDQAREAMLVAFGIHKTALISAALKGNWCNVLVTDSATADLLMSL